MTVNSARRLSGGNTPLFVLCIILLLSALFSNSYAQQRPPVVEANKIELQSLSTQYDKTYQDKQSKFADLRKKHNWPENAKRKNGGYIALHDISPSGFPIYVRVDNNTTAAATTRTNYVQPGGALNLNLSGSSTFLAGKLGIWDGGAPLATHQEFAGKTITIHDTQLGTDEHATHVSGTMIAKGVYGPAKGMAFGMNTLVSYDFNNDVSEMSSQAANLLLSNHSYGTIAGWDYDSSTSRWYWYGLPGDSVDYKFGFYGSQAQAFDNIAVKAPQYLIVESAGNSRGYPGPAVGSDYWGYNSRTDRTFVDKGNRPATISSNTYYDIIPDFANAKNILTVGAVNPIPGGPTSKNDVQVSFFSSWGPTDDGRVKPDIMGDGLNVTSTGSASNTSYVTLSGTSMAAPNVTGSLLLLQEYWAKQNAGAFMRSATLKGLACGTAFDAGNAGPDYIYGWGLLDMQKAAQAITDNGTKSIIKENSLATGQTQTFNVVASGNGPLVSTICWTDPQGTITADGTVNSRTPKLINDLDIKVSDGTTTYLAWVLDPDHPNAAATTGNNIRDNVEQVYIANPVPGRQYTISITHKGTLNTGSQAYSLVSIGGGGSIYCASAPASTADSRINNFTFAGINNTPAAGCTSYSDYTALTAQVEPAKTYTLSLTAGTCGGNFNKIAKVYVDWNSDGDFTDANELIATTGVISATGTFTTTITAPPDLIVGNYTRLRVVLSETNDPTTISPCGTYAKGETQDYRVQFIQPSIDAGATNVQGANPIGLCAGKTNFIVTIKNFGTVTLTSVPVTLSIKAPDGTVTTFNETYTGSIAPNASVDYVFNNTYTVQAGSTYVLTGATNLAADPITSDNQTSANLPIAPTPVPTALSAFYCVNTSSYQLTGTGGPALLWYPSATAAVPVAAGNLTSTTTPPANGSYYVGINDFSATVGPATKSAFSGGGYNQFGPYVTVKTAIPVVIQSARLYIGNSGQITFSVADSTGQIVSTTTINAVATRTTPGAGAQVDDPADQGRVYTLNLVLPNAGTYTINTTYDANATLFRSNAGVTGYPFGVGNIFNITTNSATPNPQTFYYYFYNMQVVSYGCPSTSRVAVALTKPIITRNGNVLNSNYATGNQWYFNGVAIPGATGSTLSPVESGNYQVAVAVSGSCTSISDNFAFALTALHPDNSDIGLALFPNPANTKINLAFTAKTAGTLVLTFVNSAGQIQRQEERTIAAGAYSTVVSTASLPAGTYVLKLTLGGETYSKKVIVIR
ncbi:S8 family serine peptidase [Mucilaginibacter ginkgonis]|uniref:S8 family serine peptidase n=1 Tax=Mucilaginibacter ginkgonis TaxID=2682091 RepID=A0A7T7FBL3_9SPHI|nr:S8 family serine peptidase [Mucilaginibacter ginkgonis]QQL50090.1 S8 family serine peptidase [Mucilaginibacter ginkgonis]